MRILRSALFLPILLAVSVEQALADVDLVTIPRREGTQLTIYNSEDITMVREHRLLTVKEGVNRIQFTWASTLIDPTSIDFRILDGQDHVDLIDTTFPAGRNDALEWNIRSRLAGKIPVEIRYFSSGVTWAADYAGLANEDETRLQLTGYVRVMNGSGETYDNAETRLVVGTINLVEKIADLATRPAPGEQRDLGEQRGRPIITRYEHHVEKAERQLARFGRGAMAGMGGSERARQVVKEGLSEYFLFTIARRLKDQRITNVLARQYKRRIDDEFVMYYDLIDYSETSVYEEEVVSGKPDVAKVEIERKFDANVVLWANDEKPDGWESDEPGAYVDLRQVPGRVEKVDENHVKYFLDLVPGEKCVVRYPVTYKRRKVGPELNQEKKREPL